MTRDEYAKAFIDDAKARGKSKEETRAKFDEAMASYDAKYPKKEVKPKNEQSGLQSGFNRFVEKTNFLGLNDLRQKPEVREAARAALEQRSSRLGEEKTGFEKTVETIAKPVAFLSQMGAETVGKLSGGKKGSAIGAGSMAGTQTLIEEMWQNVTGRQEDISAMGATKPFIDAGKAAAIDFVFNVAFDDVIPATKSKLGKTAVGKLFKKGSKKIDSLAGEVVAKGAKAYENLAKNFGDPKKVFLDEGMNEVPWWQLTKNKFGKNEPLGVVLNYEKIAKYSDDMLPFLKAADDAGIKMTRDSADSLINGLPKQLQREGFDDAAIKEIMGDVNGILDDVLKKDMSSKEILDKAIELGQGTFTSTGKVRRAFGPNAQNKAGRVNYHLPAFFSFARKRSYL